MTTEENKSPPQHTPGPWEYNPTNGLIYSLDRTLICDVCPDPASSETPEHHANGFLIDALPELFEGAEAAVAAFDNLKPLLTKEFLKSHGHDLSMAIEALRDAVATALRWRSD
jgi:hypothetical protein